MRDKNSKCDEKGSCPMTYVQFKTQIRNQLTAHRQGMTWRELQTSLRLPYERPCPTWIKQLEAEIGLQRRKTTSRALVWSLQGVSG